MSIDALSTYDKCLQKCKDTPTCTHFTFTPTSSFLYVFGVAFCDTFASAAAGQPGECKLKTEETGCPTCKSGEAVCPEIGLPKCNEDFCYHGTPVNTIRDVPDVFQCHAFCNNVTQCDWYSFYKDTLVCQLLIADGGPDEIKDKCLSGQQGCQILGDPVCGIPQACNGKSTGLGLAGSAEQCLKSCQIEKDPTKPCNWFSFHQGDNLCYFFESCPEAFDGDGKYISGEKRCTSLGNK